MNQNNAHVESIFVSTGASSVRHRIGVMQGRLSPPRGGRIQSFPVDTWREEFGLARQAGLDCIEWIYEMEAAENNNSYSGGRINIQNIKTPTKTTRKIVKYVDFLNPKP